MKKILYFFSFLVLLQACGSSVNLPGFDSKRWKSDPMGCEGKRKNLLAVLKKESDRLKSLSPNQIIGLLGIPDKQELYERNQRYYLYFYAKGLHCKGKKDIDLSQVPIVRIRFSAIDMVTEVQIQ